MYDWYKISAATNDEITFVGIPEESLNLFMTLFNTNGLNCFDLWKKWAAGWKTIRFRTVLQIREPIICLLTQVGHGSYTLSTSVQNPTTFVDEVMPYELNTFPNPFTD